MSIRKGLSSGASFGFFTRLSWALSAALAAPLVLAWTALALQGGGGSLRDAPVLVVGPSEVTGALVDQADGLENSPLAAGSTEDADAARRFLIDGDVVGIVFIDLAGTRDELLLPADRSRTRDRQLIKVVTALEAPYERTLEVRRAAPARGAADGAPNTLLPFVAVVLGFAAVVLISVLRGPIAPTFRTGLARLGVCCLVGLTLGIFLSATGWPSLESHGVTPAVVLAVAVVAAAVTTLACEVLAGLPGLLLAAVTLLGVPLPLLVADDRYLLPSTSAKVTEWTIVGAAVDSMGANSAGTAMVQPALVLGGSIVMSLLILGSWRFAQQRAKREGQATPRNEAVATSDRETDRPQPLSPSPSLRRQLLALLVGSLVFTTGAYKVWATGDARPSESPASLASTTSCVKTRPIRSIADLNAITRLRGSAFMQGGDIGASASLQDGRQVWLFGDTIRGSGVAGGSFVRNSMLLVEPGCLRVVVPKSGGAIIPNRADGVGYWPMSVVVDRRTGYDLVTVMAQRVRTVRPEDVFGFEALGPSTVTFVVPLGGTPQRIATADLTRDDADTNRPMWGAAAASDGTWVYLYGTARPASAEPGTGFSMRVARTKVAGLSDVAMWRYWDGRSWAAEPARAAELISAEDGVSQTLSVFSREGRWFAFSKRDEFLGQDLVFWTAPRPTGPFTARPPVAQLPSDSATGTLRYMPLAHPNLLTQKRALIVSYSRNQLDVQKVLGNPLLYRPRFLRLPLPVEPH